MLDESLILIALRANRQAGTTVDTVSFYGDRVLDQLAEQTKRERLDVLADLEPWVNEAGGFVERVEIKSEGMRPGKRVASVRDRHITLRIVLPRDRFGQHVL